MSYEVNKSNGYTANKTPSSMKNAPLVQECYKKLIASVLLQSFQKRKFEDLGIEDILSGSNVITFPTADEENSDARLFVAHVRANRELNGNSSSLIELLIYPIYEKVHVDAKLHGMLSEFSEPDSYISGIVGSIDCRISLQLYIHSVEKELLNSTVIDTNILYSDYQKEGYSLAKTKADRHILTAYLITFLIEYVQVGPLSKNKIQVVKNILRRLNKNY